MGKKLIIAGLMVMGCVFVASGYQDDFRSMNTDLKEVDSHIKRFEEEEKLRRIEEKARQRVNEIEQKRLRGEYETSFRDEQFLTREHGVFDARVRNALAGKKMYVLSFATAILVLAGVGLALYLLYGRKHPDARVRENQTHGIAQVNTWVLTEADMHDLLDELAKVLSQGMLNVRSSGFRGRFIQDLVLSELLLEMALSKNIGQDTDEATNAAFESWTRFLPGSPQAAQLIGNYSRRIGSAQPVFPDYYQSFFFLLCLAYRNDPLYLAAIKRKYIFAVKIISGLKTTEAFTREIDVFRRGLKIYRLNV